MVATAATRKAYKANVISTGLKEAGEKLDYARNFYHSIPDEYKELGLKPVIYNDASDTLSFHYPPDTSYIISQPASSAVRGGKKDIYFDEAAHISGRTDFRELYKAAAPATIRGEGRVTIISTPFGQSGLFYEIAIDRVQYPDFSVHVVPWWESSIMVREGAIEDAMAECPLLDTKTRVEKYGSSALLRQWALFAGDIVGFQTEFECMFVDEAEAYFPIQLVMQRAVVKDYWDKIPESIDRSKDYAIGVDVAKERDESVFVVSEIDSTDPQNIHKRVIYITSSQAPYHEQVDLLNNMVKRIQPRRVTIDKTGVGNAFFEQVQRSGMRGNLEGVAFTNAKKEEWATKFKGELQLGTVEYPHLPELVRQIHGIRRTKTEANFYKFSGKPRDDYFWALMLSLYGESRVPSRITIL